MLSTGQLHTGIQALRCGYRVPLEPPWDCKQSGSRVWGGTIRYLFQRLHERQREVGCRETTRGADSFREWECAPWLDGDGSRWETQRSRHDGTGALPTIVEGENALNRIKTVYLILSLGSLPHWFLPLLSLQHLTERSHFLPNGKVHHRYRQL